MISKNRFWSIITVLIVGLILVNYTTHGIEGLKYDLTYQTLDARLSDAQHRVERNYKKYSENLYYDHNYEPEFDAYWELATIEDTYVMSKVLQRAIEEGAGSYQAELDSNIDKMNDYVNSSADYYGRVYIKKLTEQLEK